MQPTMYHLAYRVARPACLLALAALLATAPCRAAVSGTAAPTPIVLAAASVLDANGVSTSALWRLALDGSARSLLQAPPGSSLSVPTRSADGAHLAYLVDGRALWQLDAGAPSPRQLYALPIGGYQLVLNPRYQGNALTFTAGCCAAFAMYRLSPSGAFPRQLAGGDGRRLLQDWSPDGRHLLYTVDGALWVADANGEHPQPVGNDAPGAGSFLDARYSPDGTHIVASLRPAQGADEGEHRVLVLLHPDGRYLTVLTHDLPLDASGPTWSPDGKRIAFMVASGALGSLGRLHDLWMMRYDGADKRNMTHGRLGDVQGAAWGR